MSAVDKPTDEQVLQGLDFDPTVWCEGTWITAVGAVSTCQREAMFTAQCPSCDTRFPMCGSHVAAFRVQGTTSVRCGSCRIVLHAHEFTFEALS